MKNFQIFYDALKATFQDKGVPFPPALASILEPPMSGNNAQAPAPPPPILYVYFFLTSQCLRWQRQQHQWRRFGLLYRVWIRWTRTYPGSTRSRWWAIRWTRQDRESPTSSITTWSCECVWKRQRSSGEQQQCRVYSTCTIITAQRRSSRQTRGCWKSSRNLQGALSICPWNSSWKRPDYKQIRQLPMAASDPSGDSLSISFWHKELRQPQRARCSFYWWIICVFV